VLRAALSVVDEEGLSALSMRRLGRELSVEAMSLYRYVRNKGDLLDGLHETVLAQMRTPELSGDWLRDAKAVALAFRDALYEHREAIPVFVTRAAVTPGSLMQLERGLAILRGAGFPPVMALSAFQALYTLVVGSVAFHYGPSASEEEAPDFSALPADTFPNLRGLDLATYDADEELELAIDAMLAGLASRL